MRPLMIVVLALALVLAACSGDAEPVQMPSTAASPTAQTRSAFELEPGNCLNAPAGLSGSLREVELVDCQTTHQIEVFAVLDYDAGDTDPYPGDRVLTRFAGNECRGERFREYVGIPKADSELFVLWATPARDTWAQGDREIVCLLHLGEERLSGSMRGSRR
jgi:hypothetical protein